MRAKAIAPYTFDDFAIVRADVGSTLDPSDSLPKASDVSDRNRRAPSSPRIAGNTVNITRRQGSDAQPQRHDVRLGRTPRLETLHHFLDIEVVGVRTIQAGAQRPAQTDHLALANILFLALQQPKRLSDDLTGVVVVACLDLGPHKAFQLWRE